MRGTPEKKKKNQRESKQKTYITQVHPTPSPSASGPSLVARAARAVGPAPPLAPAPHLAPSEIDAPGAGKSLGRGAEVLVEVHVLGEDLVEDAQEAPVLAERPRRRRELRRRADRQARVGRLRGQVGQQVGGRRGGRRVGKDFLREGGGSAWPSLFFLLFFKLQENEMGSWMVVLPPWKLPDEREGEKNRTGEKWDRS